MHRMQSCYIVCLQLYHRVRHALRNAPFFHQLIMTCRHELVMSVGTALQRAGPPHIPPKDSTGGSLEMQQAHRKAVGRGKRRRKETVVQANWSALQAAANHSAVRQAAWQSKRVPCSRGVLPTEVDKFCCTSTGQLNLLPGGSSQPSEALFAHVPKRMSPIFNVAPLYVNIHDGVESNCRYRISCLCCLKAREQAQAYYEKLGQQAKQPATGHCT